MATMITFHVPEDTALLAGFGEVALRHEHLNHILRMTIKTLGRLRPQEALDATAYDGSRQLRERIRKLARQRLGEGEALLKLEALLERCRRVTDKRNELTHGIWAKELDGEPMRRGTDQNWYPLPTVDELKALANQTWLLSDELNTARLDGFLSQALAKRRQHANENSDDA
jgi:hypothetical protein